MTSIVIFGAGGRAGRAVTAEAQRRGVSVTGVVRDPAKHHDLTADRTVRGDLLDAGAIPDLVAGHDAVINAVSPASGPESLAELGALDEKYYVLAADALLHGLESVGVPRLIVIGLFANLTDASGNLLLDDPAQLPQQFRHFAVAHTAGLDRLRSVTTDVDWLVLTPPAQLDATAPRTGRYRTGGDVVAGSTLSYADLAVAVVDEIESPRHHRTRVSIFD
ncbi:NAD(P)-dependent oxidoreductase [Actinoplanes utahensis]|uniref:Flavin reductase n=1 Tax=Actinoplanes utahensis TaxID=1869 RepID=A0A0A6UPH0_ACTUT|nr:NAD(P)H-binding protein [Actinoplanes utahensis]KHD78045.1 flavin reductase [Actinoplanes utahensis]GIF30058.1 putative epimerase/dehydratase [Actinoplanes utahensis]